MLVGFFGFMSLLGVVSVLCVEGLAMDGDVPASTRVAVSLVALVLIGVTLTMWLVEQGRL